MDYRDFISTLELEHAQVTVARDDRTGHQTA